MKSQRDFRNYLAGGALAFGVVLLTSQILRLIYGGLIMNIYFAAHLAGGFLGGYLVARVRGKDFTQTGTVTAVMAYILEFVYMYLFEGEFTDYYAVLSLLIGGIIGAMFFRARMERERISALQVSPRAL